MKYLIFLPILFVLLSCEGNTAARKAARGPFFVAEPNHLYFKNTRLRYYAAEESGENSTVYRHDDLWASGALLLPAIVDDWLRDQARLRFDLRLTPDGPGEARPFRLDLERRSSWKTLSLTVPPTLEEITRLQQHLATQQELRIVMGLDTLDPFPGVSRKAAKEVLDDYLRLVGE